MEKLPVEILKCIFDKFHYNQKIRCALVCRRWADIIHSYSLFYDLTIHKTPHGKPGTMHSWEKRIREQPKYGKQVRQLSIEDCLMESYDVSVLPTLFPFIRSLAVYQSHLTQSTVDEKQSARFKLWHERLESLMEATGYGFTYTLLSTGTFNRLHSIAVDSRLTFDITLNQLFERFNHAPSLKHIKLERFLLNIALLELLHKNTTKLTSFIVVDSIFFSETLSPETIEPVKSIETFHLSNVRFALNSIDIWAHYIISKYPNVNDLSIATKYLGVEGLDNNQFHFQLLHPIFKSFGPQLKALRITSGPCKSEWLDHQKKKLHTLQLNHAFWNPKTLPHQFEHLHTLSIINMKSNDFSWLKSIVCLEKLKIDFLVQDDEDKEQKVLLNQLVCSERLKTLVILHGDVTVGTDVSNSSCTLQRLKIKYGDIDKLAVAFISKHCSQLRTLSLIDMTIESWAVYLPMHTMSYFEVTTLDNKTDVKVTSYDGTRVYSPNHRFSMTKQSMKKGTITLDKFRIPRSTLTSITATDQNSKTTIHLTCQSLHNLFINGHFAF